VTSTIDTPLKWTLNTVFPLKVALKYSNYSKNMKNITYTEFQEVRPVAKCGEWQQGWTTLLYMLLERDQIYG